jgi:hypothetical protein
LACSRPGFIENLERLTFAVSLGHDLQVSRFAQRLARPSPQSSALPSCATARLTCENASLAVKTVAQRLWSA